MKKIPSASVIILNWNRKDDTLETIVSLSKSLVRNFTLEICVVDNGSTDGSQEAIEKLFKEIERPGKVSTRILKLKENLGFAEGNNRGMKDALLRGFDYIALLNNDTIVGEDLVVNIIAEHNKFSKAGAISPKIYFAKGFEFQKKYKKEELGKVIWYAGGNMDWKNVYGTNNGVDQVDKGQFNESKETDFTTGCFVMYKSEALNDVGLYDERYFAYVEDADHAQRMKQKGWKELYSPKGSLWHKVSQSSVIGGGLNDYYLTRNRMLFGMKYASVRTKFALFRESIKLLLSGRIWQKIGIRDYYLGRFGKGSWR